MKGGGTEKSKGDPDIWVLTVYSFTLRTRRAPKIQITQEQDRLAEFSKISECVQIMHAKVVAGGWGALKVMEKIEMDLER